MERPLFGGAITAMMPSHLIDVSDLRQVPDNQEVFLYPDSGVSIIIEVLQQVESSNLGEAARFHFDSLAHDNTAESSDIHSVNTISNEKNNGTPSVTILAGVQRVAKFNRTSLDTVNILIGLFRVENKKIDLVVTANIPIKTEDGGGVDADTSPSIEADFDTLIRSLRIVDFGLFA